MLRGHNLPGVVTGKPLAIGGTNRSRGRDVAWRDDLHARAC
jgi:glutamate dehydrogenase/leucine dehydrogenase